MATLKTITDSKTKPPLVVAVLGPTAVGKTAVSIALAKVFDGEIISADSRQFYRKMDIGTAKATADEQRQVPHHFIDILDLPEPYTAGKFGADALACIKEISSRGKLPIITGGSGLYVNALLYGLDDIPSDLSVRNELNSIYESRGISYLQQQLLEADPEYYKTGDIQNPVRVIRALEVWRISNKPYSQWRQNSSVQAVENIIHIGLTLPRELLYQKINARVDQMFSDGLIGEATALMPYSHCQPLNTIGYREVFQYLRGELAREETIELIKRNTRRYAKRQLTWLRKNSQITWFDPNKIHGIRDFVQKQLP